VASITAGKPRKDTGGKRKLILKGISNGNLVLVGANEAVWPLAGHLITLSLDFVN
jgi:hypothetical protein